jgi:hypothetical protein
MAAPTVTTQSVTGIMSLSAVGRGNITAFGVDTPTQHGVCWSTSANPTISDSKTEEGAPTETGSFTSQITGLTSGTLYHVRAYATNSDGTAYGIDTYFTAAPSDVELYTDIMIAIRKLAQGSESWTVDGTTYKRTDMSKLMAMKKQLANDAAKASGRRPFMKRSKFTGMGYS